MSPPSPISHVLELCLYVKDITKSNNFYTNILGLKQESLPSFLAPRMSVYPIGNTTLLLFALGKTSEDQHPNPAKPELCVPGHGPEEGILSKLLQDGEGGEKLRQHYCLAVGSKEEAIEWEKYLKEQGVECKGKMEWPRGGYSVYFLDPDGHVGEIASQGIWSHY